MIIFYLNDRISKFLWLIQYYGIHEMVKCLVQVVIMEEKDNTINEYAVLKNEKEIDVGLHKWWSMCLDCLIEFKVNNFCGA